MIMFISDFLFMLYIFTFFMIAIVLYKYIRTKKTKIKNIAIILMKKKLSIKY